MSVSKYFKKRRSGLQCWLNNSNYSILLGYRSRLHFFILSIDKCVHLQLETAIT